MSKIVKSESVLDLPINRQKEIAKAMGFGDDLESWKVEIQKSHDEAKAHLDSLTMINYNDLSPEEQAAHRRWGEKVASGNPR